MIRRWATFVWERFPPGAYLPLIALLYAANALIARRAVGLEPGIRPLAALVLLLVFFHLRLFDERKDLEHDRQHNPERPLPRGLIGERELRRAWYAAITAELVLAAFLGVPALVGAACVIGYSVVMLEEFWVRAWLRPKLYTYAVSHTLVTPLMSLFVMAAETGRMPWDPPPASVPFALAGWGLFLVFEVARKTYAPDQERPGVATYTSLHGTAGATALVVLQAGLAALATGLALEAVGAPAWATVATLSLPLLVLAPATWFDQRPSRRSVGAVRAAATAFLLLACALPVAALAG